MFDNKHFRIKEDSELGEMIPQTHSSISYRLCTQHGRLREINYQQKYPIYVLKEDP